MFKEASTFIQTCSSWLARFASLSPGASVAHWGSWQFSWCSVPKAGCLSSPHLVPNPERLLESCWSLVPGGKLVLTWKVPRCCSNNRAPWRKAKTARHALSPFSAMTLKSRQLQKVVPTFRVGLPISLRQSGQFPYSRDCNLYNCKINHNIKKLKIQQILLRIQQFFFNDNRGCQTGCNFLPRQPLVISSEIFDCQEFGCIEWVVVCFLVGRVRDRVQELI